MLKRDRLLAAKEVLLNSLTIRFKYKKKLAFLYFLNLIRDLYLSDLQKRIKR